MKIVGCPGPRRSRARSRRPCGSARTPRCSPGRRRSGRGRARAPPRSRAGHRPPVPSGGGTAANQPRAPRSLPRGDRHRSFTGDGWFQPSSPLLHRALRRVGDAPAMARIIVVAGSPAEPVGPALYEERVGTPVLEGAHASAQFLQRIAWAVADAEEAERESARSDLGFDAQRRGVWQPSDAARAHTTTLNASTSRRRPRTPRNCAARTSTARGAAPSSSSAPAGRRRATRAPNARARSPPATAVNNPQTTLTIK